MKGATLFGVIPTVEAYHEGLHTLVAFLHGMSKICVAERGSLQVLTLSFDSVIPGELRLGTMRMIYGTLLAGPSSLPTLPNGGKHRTVDLLSRTVTFRNDCRSQRPPGESDVVSPS